MNDFYKHFSGSMHHTQTSGAYFSRDEKSCVSKVVAPFSFL